MASLTYRLGTVVHRAGFAWRARRAVRLLARGGTPRERALASALGAALGAEADPIAAARMAPIEALRRALLSDEDTLSFQDYGVPHRIGTAEAVPGRTVTRSVRDIATASAPAHEARVLFHVIRGLRPRRCLELGTCLGISAAYQAAALDLNGAGHLITLEGGETLARRAETHLATLALADRVTVVPGRFLDTLPGVLGAHGPFDYVFVDGHHDPGATLAYYRLLTPHLADDAVLVFDDIAWSAGMRRAWRSIAAEPAVAAAVDLLAFGVCLF